MFKKEQEARMRELFLTKEIMDIAHARAVEMLSSGIEQRKAAEITFGGLPNGPKFIVSIESNDLMILNTFKVDDVEFHLGCRR